MSAAALYGLLAWAALLGIAAGLTPHRWRRLPLTVAAAGLALAPVFGGESPAMWMHGALGAPSMTLLLIAGRHLQAPASPPLLNRPAAALIVLGALIFYPLTLGWGAFDPYTLGYRPLPLLLALAPLGAWLAWRRQEAWLLVLAGGLLAYAGGIFGNLWDALLDPLLVLLAAVSLAGRSIRR